MLRKALDEDGKRLFQDGEKAVLKNSVEASVLQEIQLAMLNSGTGEQGGGSESRLKKLNDWFFLFFLAQELKMTVVQLTERLTQEELNVLGCFFERNEQEQKAMDQAKAQGAR